VVTRVGEGKPAVNCHHMYIVGFVVVVYYNAIGCSSLRFFCFLA
jgi:hypothetical protein